MKLKVTIPENISEITLRQFVKYDELLSRNLSPENFTKRKISLFANIPFNQIGKMRSQDSERILNQINTALNTDAKFTNRFTMHGIEFGFIPNFDKITMDEYADLTTYGVDKTTLHQLMAVLFRPIINTSGDKYEIMAYTGTEQHAEMMKDTPLNVVNGALVFFWNLASELQEATQKYLSEELVRENKPRTFLRTLVGMFRLRNLQTMTYLK